MSDLERGIADVIDEMRKPMAVGARGALLCVDVDTARVVAKGWGVPDASIGIPTTRWQRFVQRHFTRRARQRARRG